MTHPRTLRALTATIPLLQEARAELKVARVAVKLRARIDRCMARLRRLGLVKRIVRGDTVVRVFAPGEEGDKG